MNMICCYWIISLNELIRKHLVMSKKRCILLAIKLNVGHFIMKLLHIHQNKQQTINKRQRN